MARISKPPEVRRQEILDTAMELFAEKGYEDTSMADIARRMGVVQGLCYRYFDSKRVLFREAMEQYVRECWRRSWRTPVNGESCAWSIRPWRPAICSTGRSACWGNMRCPWRSGWRSSGAMPTGFWSRNTEQRLRSAGTRVGGKKSPKE